MTKKYVLTNQEIKQLCLGLSPLLSDWGYLDKGKVTNVYGIPRGGIPAAYMLQAMFSENICVVDNPQNADFFFDDIIDSGETMKEWTEKYPGKPFFALIDKTSGCDEKFKEAWIVFPWEQREGLDGQQDDFHFTVTRLLQHIGENPNRGGLLETPKRVAKAWQFWTKGYSENPAEVLKVFEDGAEDCDDMVVVKNIPFYSHCEHHLAPIFGTATIAYIPNGKIVGLSKLSRLLDVFARRLQVQERLTNQVVDALMEHLDALGAGVVIKARHLCMESRGVCQQGHYTVTSALRGVMKDKPETRAEFLALANSSN